MFVPELDKFRKSRLLRHVRDRSGPMGRTITLGGKQYINFASNDYLGLAAHPRLKEAMFEAMEQYGTGAGASRLLGGGTGIHASLEKSVAEFKGTPEALIMGSGYIANVSACAALAGKDDAIFSDELNHASLIDGCRLSKAAISAVLKDLSKPLCL